MSDRLAAERACKDANPIIDGRKANVNLAYLGAKPRGNLQAGEFNLPFIHEEEMKEDVNTESKKEGKSRPLTHRESV